MRYGHAIALETSQQQQDIFLVRALFDFETDILWQLHWRLLPKHVVLDLTSLYSGLRPKENSCVTIRSSSVAATSPWSQNAVRLSPFKDRPLKSGPDLQIGVMQPAREGSPPPGLRLPQTKLSRKYNQVARGRIRQFESNMPSHAVDTLAAGDTPRRRQDALDDIQTTFTRSG
jgi:hypothetical protein